MAKGRMAAESAEKSGGINFRREIEEHRKTLPGAIRQFQEDKGKGIERPEYPSEKAQEYMRRGRPVVFT
jgi:hypothetical protein